MRAWHAKRVMSDLPTTATAVSCRCMATLFWVWNPWTKRISIPSKPSSLMWKACVAFPLTMRWMLTNSNCWWNASKRLSNSRQEKTSPPTPWNNYGEQSALCSIRGWTSAPFSTARWKASLQNGERQSASWQWSLEIWETRRQRVFASAVTPQQAKIFSMVNIWLMHRVKMSWRASAHHSKSPKKVLFVGHICKALTKKFV